MPRQKKQSFRFPLETLKIIIDSNLMLFNYYQQLEPILLDSNKGHDVFRDDFAEFCRNLITNAICEKEKPRSQLKSCSQPRRVSINPVCDKAFEYELVEASLESKEFIEKLHPYTNSLLTTTNIGIIRETLKIYTMLENNYDRTAALHRIRKIVNVMTLYQINKNVTAISCRFQLLNQILNQIGLIITRKQFEFYDTQIWSDLPMESPGNQQPQQDIWMGGDRSQPCKYLQIYDLLKLSVQLEEIKVIRNKLSEWIGHEEFRKYYNKNKVNRLTSHKFAIGLIDNSNIRMAKINIQNMTPMELLEEVEIRGYDIDTHCKKYAVFRKKVLEDYDIQQERKKIYNSINSKTAKHIPNFARTEHNLAATKAFTSASKTTLHENTAKSTSNSELRRDNQQKMEQMAFNSKLLNGEFVRQQIYNEINQGRANVLQSGPCDKLNKKAARKSSFMDQENSVNRVFKEIQSTTKADKVPPVTRFNKKTSINIGVLPTQMSSCVHSVKIIKNPNNFYEKALKKAKAEGISQFYFKPELI